MLKLALPADAQAWPLEDRFDFIARDPREVARQRVLDRAGGHAVVEPLLQVAVQQAVDQARGEAIAGAEAIDNFYLEGPRSQDFAGLAGDGGPGVLPHQRVFAQRDRHGLQAESLGGLRRRVGVVASLDAE